LTTTPTPDPWIQGQPAERTARPSTPGHPDPGLGCSSLAGSPPGRLPRSSRGSGSRGWGGPPTRTRRSWVSRAERISRMFRHAARPAAFVRQPWRFRGDRVTRWCAALSEGGERMASAAPTRRKEQP
jgi:hypothetical protein